MRLYAQLLIIREQTPLLYPVTREGSHDPHFAVDISSAADAIDYTIRPAAAALTGWECTMEAGIATVHTLSCP
jgi:hypothetical protein